MAIGFYQIKVGLNSSQSEIIDLLKNAGAEVIQVSDGLAIKSAESLDKLKTALNGLAEAPAIEVLNKEEVAANEHATENLKSFLGIN